MLRGQAVVTHLQQDFNGGVSLAASLIHLGPRYLDWDPFHDQSRVLASPSAECLTGKP